MRSVPNARADTHAATVRGGFRRPTRSKTGDSFPARPLRSVYVGAAKRIARKVKLKEPAITETSMATAPVAVHLDGAVIGLALKIDNGFRFLSAAHRTDAFDGEVFTTVDAICEAVGGNSSPSTARQ